MNIDTLTYRIRLGANTHGLDQDLYYDLIFGLLLFIGITFLFGLLKNKIYMKLWMIKAFVTLIAMVAYEYTYGLDAYSYYANAVNYTGLFEGGTSGTTNIVIMNHFFTYFVGDSYYALKLLNSLIGFFGLLFLYKSYEHIMHKNGFELKKDYFIYVLFLFPSVLFWSSILGKDPINLFFVGVFTYGFIKFIDKVSIKFILLIIIGIVGVYFIRTWWSVIMIMAASIYYIRFRSVIHILALLVYIPIFYMLMTVFLHSIEVYTFQDIFERMTSTAAGLARGGSSIETAKITGFMDYAIYYIPNLFTSLYRPMPWDVNNPFSLLAAIENVFLLYFTYKYIIKNWRNVLRNKHLRFLILFIFSWSLFYVIISPTNLGMAVRFKLQVLPAMLIVIWVSRYIYLQKQKQKQDMIEVERKRRSIGQRAKRDLDIEKQ